jgi:hypothetical protein
MPKEEFRAHATDVINSTVEALSGVNDALRQADLAQVRLEADRWYQLLREDDAWQRAHEDEILGGCYDEAAAAYSTFVVYANSTARAWIDFADNPTDDNREAATYWGDSSSSALNDYAAAIAAAC